MATYSEMNEYSQYARVAQPPQVGAYTLSAKSVTDSVILDLKHFLNEFLLFSQFFLAVQVHTFMVFLTKFFSSIIFGDY